MLHIIEMFHEIYSVCPIPFKLYQVDTQMFFLDMFTWLLEAKPHNLKNPIYFLYPILEYADTFTLFPYYMHHGPNFCIMCHCFLDVSSVSRR